MKLFSIIQFMTYSTHSNKSEHCSRSHPRNPFKSSRPLEMFGRRDSFNAKVNYLLRYFHVNHQENERKLLFFIIMFSNVLGLVTFTIKTVEMERHSELLLQRSAIATAWNIILIIIILYTNYLIPILDEIKGLHPYQYIIDAMKAAECILASLVIVGLWIYFLLRQNESTRIANKFLKIDKLLEKYYHFYELKRSKDYFRVFLTLFLILWCIAVWIEWKTYTFYGKFMWHMWWHKYLFPHFVISVFVIQYKIVIKTMRRRIRSLNDGIVRMMDTSNQFHYKLSINRKMIINKSILQDFEVLKDAYERLYELSMEIGKFYSFPILIVLAYVSYVVLAMVFLLATQMNLQIGGIVGKMNAILWLVMVIPLTIMLILEIEGLVGEVKYFTEELLHKRLQFTACGLFTLDSTFFLSVFSGVLTYLIIIFQVRGPPTPEIAPEIAPENV